jgi:hypothetical protein
MAANETQIFTVACQYCGSLIAGHIVDENSEGSLADIGRSALHALRNGRVMGMRDVSRGARLGGCGPDCPKPEQAGGDEDAEC